MFTNKNTYGYNCNYTENKFNYTCIYTWVNLHLYE